MLLKDLRESEDRESVYSWFRKYARVVEYGDDVSAEEFVDRTLGGDDTSYFVVTFQAVRNNEVLEVPIQLGEIYTLNVNQFVIKDTKNLPKCKTLYAESLTGNLEAVGRYCMQSVDVEANFIHTPMTLDEVFELLGSGKKVNYDVQVVGMANGTRVSKQLQIFSFKNTYEVLFGSKLIIGTDDLFDLQAALVDHDEFAGAFRS